MVGSMKIKTLLYAFICVSLSAHAIEDPTRPQAANSAETEQRLSAPELSSILYSADRKWAVINGEVLTVGEIVDGFELSAIEQHSVVLVRNNRNIHLSLDKEGFDGRDI